MPVLRIYHLYFSPHRAYVRKLKNILGFVPGNIKLYQLAFRHKSVATTVKGGVKNSNESGESLGVSVLGSVVAELLCQLYPDKDEGSVPELRTTIVSRANLKQLPRKLRFNELVEYDARTLSYPHKQGAWLGDALEAADG